MSTGKWKFTEQIILKIFRSLQDLKDLVDVNYWKLEYMNFVVLEVASIYLCKDSLTVLNKVLQSFLNHFVSISFRQLLFKVNYGTMKNNCFQWLISFPDIFTTDFQQIAVWRVEIIRTINLMLQHSQMLQLIINITTLKLTTYDNYV